jgi:hypothetical protein
MSKKLDRATHGPGWIEVIFGAVLSAILGAVLGAILLILKPVEVVKDLPKETDRDPKVVYYVEGSHDIGKGRQAQAKRKAFAEGQSVTVTEDELNSLAAPATGTSATPKPAVKPKAKPGEKGAPEAPPEDTFVTGAPNFRVREGTLQFAVPVTVNALGASRDVIVQTRGGFVKKGEVFVFEPDVFFIGSCPLQRVPFVVDYVRGKFVSAQPIPEELKASWLKLASVAIEGNALKLTMP